MLDDGGDDDDGDDGGDDNEEDFIMNVRFLKTFLKVILFQLEKIVHAGIFLPLRGFDKQGRYALLIRVGQVIEIKLSCSSFDKAITSTKTLTSIRRINRNQNHHFQYE